MIKGRNRQVMGHQEKLHLPLLRSLIFLGLEIDRKIDRGRNTAWKEEEEEYEEIFKKVRVSDLMEVNLDMIPDNLSNPFDVKVAESKIVLSLSSDLILQNNSTPINLKILILSLYIYIYNLNLNLTSYY